MILPQFPDASPGQVRYPGKTTKERNDPKPLIRTLQGFQTASVDLTTSVS